MPTADSHLATELRAAIERYGPMPLEDFWRAAQTSPDGGYYMRGAPIGAEGDFVTAPEISQIFGELIGLWLAEAWTQAGSPDPFTLMELGPGRGQLMSDALRAARVAPGFVESARLVLVEASPAMQDVQEELLGGAEPVWRDSWQDALERDDDAPLFLVANEFLDALPIRQLERSNGDWRERRVGLSADGAFAFAAGPAVDPPDTTPIPGIADAPEGAVLEHSSERQALAAAIGRRISDTDGAAILVDYGHGASRLGDSLQALQSGRPADPLASPGAADITSHVDFQAVMRAAEVAGARAWGPIDQGVFLLRLGAEARAEALCHNASPEAAARVRQGLNRLLNPLQMGGLFKAMALLPGVYPAPVGFGDE